MDNPQAEKPRAVVVAVNLLWGGLALSLLRLLLEMPALMAMPKSMVVVGSLVFAMALYAFLIVKISAGRNWARITLLILVLVDLVLSAPGIPGAFAHAPLTTMLALGGSGLLLAGLIPTFLAPGKGWFSKPAP